MKKSRFINAFAESLSEDAEFVSFNGENVRVEEYIGKGYVELEFLKYDCNGEMDILESRIEHISNLDNFQTYFDNFLDTIRFDSNPIPQINENERLLKLTHDEIDIIQNALKNQINGIGNLKKTLQNINKELFDDVSKTLLSIQDLINEINDGSKDI